ncbi:hypothetical protein DM860_000903 [Cuscuta australis]|uniref:Uncharacterized protein n=1 Tax=Cuscuta australis TaxID=267555 RepID=A0A328DWW2_9ASTE|nr:hypothetical protein DM860_000903 [Cuscuta australis]
MWFYLTSKALAQHPEVVRGLNGCIVKLEPDSARRISASMQISEFNAAKADFGTDLAISTRMELNPGLYSEMELGVYDNDFMEHDGGRNEMEMATLASMAGPLEVHHGGATDDDEDDDDLNFLDDDISE